MDLIPKQYKSGNPDEAKGGLKSRGISISDKQSKLLFLLNKRVIICLALILIALVAFGGLKIYNFYIQRNIDDLKIEIKQLQGEQDIELVKKINEMEKSIGIVTDLKKNHIFSSLFFETLERVTIAEVQWRGMNLDTLQGRATLKGKAASYSFLAKQIVSFKEQGFQIDVSGITSTNNGVEFSAIIKFDPKILLK